MMITFATYACKKPNATYLKALLKHIAPITMAGEKESKKEQESLNALLIFTETSEYTYAPFTQSIKMRILTTKNIYSISFVFLSIIGCLRKIWREGVKK